MLVAIEFSKIEKVSKLLTGLNKDGRFLTMLFVTQAHNIIFKSEINAY